MKPYYINANIDDKEKKSDKPIKVLFYSRHQMTTEQRNALDNNLIVTNIFMEEDDIDAIKPLIEANDIICISGSSFIKRKFLELCPDKPVLISKNRRIPTGQYNSAGEADFKYFFVKWQVLQYVGSDVSIDYDPNNPLHTGREIDDIKLVCYNPTSVIYDHDLDKLDLTLSEVRQLKFYSKLKGRRLINGIQDTTKPLFASEKAYRQFSDILERQFDAYIRSISNFGRPATSYSSK